MEVKGKKRKRLEDAYVKYADKLYQVLLQYAKEDRYLNDVVHDTFLRYYDYMDRVEEDMLFAWLYEVGKNALTSIYRKEDRVLRGIDNPYALMKENVSVKSAEEECFEADSCKEIRKFRRGIFERLKEVNPQWYDLLMQVCILDMSQKDVAKRLDVSVQTIHSRLYRARSWIREHYQEECDEKFRKY